VNIVSPTSADQREVRSRCRPFDAWNRANLVEQLPLEPLALVARQMRPGELEEGDGDSRFPHTGVDVHEVAKAAYKKQCRHQQDDRDRDLRYDHQALQ